MKLSNLTFDQIYDLLDPSPDNFHEAFEFRWLKYMSPVDQKVHLEYSEREEMIRCTFPFHTPNGRGRIWVKRCYREINRQDVERLLEIATFLSSNLLIPIGLHSDMGAFINRFISIEQLLNIDCPHLKNQQKEKTK